jgi:hypothetical protein
MSAIDDHDFARATLPRFSGDTSVVKDSVYSTYVDRGRSPRFAVAPLIQAHVSAYDFSNVSTYISGGVGARSVNGKLLPEFLAGASLGVLDKVLITVGWHWARTERLLLGDVNEVSKLPVPSTVTDDSAVGVKWDHKIAFALSWKL